MRLVLVSAIALVLAACRAEAPEAPEAPEAVAPAAAPAAEPSVEAASDAAAHVGLMAHEPWTRPLAPGATVAAGYLQLMNHSAQAETLVSARAEGVGRVEIHDIVEVDGLLQMRPIDAGLALGVDAGVALQPGGKHLMFFDVARSWAAGESVPVTLEFASGQTLVVDFAVRDGSPGAGEHSGAHTH